MRITIIQARMGSTRLPGKVLMDLLDRPVLSWVIRAARESGASERVVVATTKAPGDDAIETFAQAEGIECFRGPDEDVLTRFIQVAKQWSADSIIRLTGDCPLLDPAVIRMMSNAFDAGGIDYIGTVTSRSVPVGMDAEVVSRDALERAAVDATGFHRSHVTSYIYEHPEDFEIAGINFLPPNGDFRLALDTEQDLDLLRKLTALLGDRAPARREIISLLRERADLVSLNAHVRQKELSEG